MQASPEAMSEQVESAITSIMARFPGGIRCSELPRIQDAPTAEASAMLADLRSWFAGMPEPRPTWSVAGGRVTIAGARPFRGVVLVASWADVGATLILAWNVEASRGDPRWRHGVTLAHAESMLRERGLEIGHVDYDTADKAAQPKWWVRATRGGWQYWDGQGSTLEDAFLAAIGAYDGFLMQQLEVER
jgi:hypothetical protein